MTPTFSNHEAQARPSQQQEPPPFRAAHASDSSTTEEPISPQETFSTADAMLFASLAVSSPIPPEEKIQTAQHYCTSSDWQQQPLVLTTLENHIADQLGPFPPDSIECTLLLPHLGEVQLNACQSADEWQIDLTFLQPAALAYARRTHPHISQRLSERLGRPVTLGLFLREDTGYDD